MSDDTPQSKPVSWTESAQAASDTKVSSTANGGSSSGTGGSTPGFKLEKGNVSQRDIFRLAKSILLIATAVYLLMALLRIFLPSPDPTKGGTDNMKDVWDYTKVFLNSIISLVLGLYFGAKKEDARKENE